MHIGQRFQHANMLQDRQHNKEENKRKNIAAHNATNPSLILLLIKLFINMVTTPQLNLHPSP